ncbi:hypothetical protein CYMTET_23600 [Cymbomonas tetramitiformis]|uniref:Uncharacterized protein n=1 Tax=Cymbomonas tetramitiformis TaxID=36881 RepID=A0AAE0FXN3_9CHLO|nr:hypothetical protein CYMTET_23600 [Cymbomonas tetramitiformis]|eukprot:gene24844-30275_t
MWTRFCAEWNQTLARRPQTVLASLLAAQSASWLGLCGAFSSLQSVIPIASPELAVGWAAARLTRKLRQPANVALAAGLVRVAPSLSAMHVSPLLSPTGGDKSVNTHFEHMRKYLTEHPSLSSSQRELIGSGISRAVSFGNWAQGPIDKYGLALYLSGKGTFLATMIFASLGASRGLDVGVLLSSWGLASDFQSDVGYMAAGAGCNVLLTPLHFLAAVHGTQAIEAYVLESTKASHGDKSEGSNGSGKEGEDEKMLQSITLSLLLFAMFVSLGAMRQLTKSASKPDETAQPDM